MAVGAHFDDIEFRAGGTLCKFHEQGWDIVYVITGRYRGDDGRGQKNVNRAIASGWGAEAVFLDLSWKDWKTKKSQEALHVMRKIMGERIPRMVLSHSSEDLHEDHYMTARLTYLSFRDAMGHLGEGSALYAWEVGSRGSFSGIPDLERYGHPDRGALLSPEPDTYVDITGYMDAKEELISRFNPWVGHHQWVKKWFREHARVLGKRTGVEYAEGFKTILRAGM